MYMMNGIKKLPVSGGARTRESARERVRGTAALLDSCCSFARSLSPLPPSVVISVKRITRTSLREREPPVSADRRPQAVDARCASRQQFACRRSAGEQIGRLLTIRDAGVAMEQPREAAGGKASERGKQERASKHPPRTGATRENIRAQSQSADVWCSLCAWCSSPSR